MAAAAAGVVCAGRFANMVCSFCERLDDAVLRSTIATFRSRVEFGVRAEAVALTAIKYIKVGLGKGPGW
jgi:DNA polymerase theta